MEELSGIRTPPGRDGAARTTSEEGAGPEVAADSGTGMADDAATGLCAADTRLRAADTRLRAAARVLAIGAARAASADRHPVPEVPVPEVPVPQAVLIECPVSLPEEWRDRPRPPAVVPGYSEGGLKPGGDVRLNRRLDRSVSRRRRKAG